MQLLKEIPFLSWGFPFLLCSAHLVCNLVSLSFKVHIQLFFFPCLFSSFCCLTVYSCKALCIIISFLVFDWVPSLPILIMVQITNHYYDYYYYLQYRLLQVICLWHKLALSGLIHRQKSLSGFFFFAVVVGGGVFWVGFYSFFFNNLSINIRPECKISKKLENRILNIEQNTDNCHLHNTK